MVPLQELIIFCQSILLSLNYTWSTLYGSYPVDISQPYLGNLCLGIYSLSVVDNMGCVFSDTIMIGNVILGCTDSTATKL